MSGDHQSQANAAMGSPLASVKFLENLSRTRFIEPNSRVRHAKYPTVVFVGTDRHLYGAAFSALDGVGKKNIGNVSQLV